MYFGKSLLDEKDERLFLFVHQANRAISSAFDSSIVDFFIVGKESEPQEQ